MGPSSYYICKFVLEASLKDSIFWNILDEEEEKNWNDLYRY